MYKNLKEAFNQLLEKDKIILEISENTLPKTHIICNLDQYQKEELKRYTLQVNSSPYSLPFRSKSFDYVLLVSGFEIKTKDSMKKYLLADFLNEAIRVGKRLVIIPKDEDEEKEIRKKLKNYEKKLSILIFPIKLEEIEWLTEENPYKFILYILIQELT
jgi:ubiquinone/menaquinone biosynthesis C-methylase UbiE